MKPDPLLLDVPEQLQSERLVLRCPRPGDGEFILPSVRESIQELKAWMPWATDDYGLEQSEQWCRKAAGNFILREQLQFLILARSEGRHLGNIGAFKFNWEAASCEIGYWLRTSETGKGYMSEAVHALTDLCVKQLKMQRIEIRCDDKNVRSAGVAERCDYKLDGILRIYSKLTGA